MESDMSEQNAPKGVPKWKRGTDYVQTGENLGAGDSFVQLDVLPEVLEKDAFENLKREVQWKTMYHHGGAVPRLVATQGEIEPDGWFPIYRHPSDQSPPLLSFSPTVAKIRQTVEDVLGHPVNHVLIQHYRSGNDYISEHSDKTIDVVRGSNIVNVSLGAQRVMILRTKKDALPPKDDPSAPTPERTSQRIPLPHNSMFVLGPETNKRWLHGIRQDKREEFLKGKEELAFDGERISLTFRYIGTFLSADQSKIYGQGATGKTKEDAKPTISGDKEAAQQMIDAFGFENQQSDFDWDATYGHGFDVLHFTNAQSEVVQHKPLLYFVNGSIPSWRVKMALHEKGVEFDETRLKVMSHPKETRLPNFLALNHRGKTPVLVDGEAKINESIAILHYIEDYLGPNAPLLPPLSERSNRARVLARIQETENLHTIYDNLEDSHFDAANGETGPLSVGKRSELVQAVYNELDFWEKYAQESEFIAYTSFTLADAAFFPFLGYMVRRGFEWDEQRWPNLKQYYERIRERDCAQKSQPEGWEGRGRANIFVGTRGGAQPIYAQHERPDTAK
ncbi:hypothetical protein FRC17_001866 [Serendipita sp. 399]|nr:hypothetical protein FRC17_001866 [Serendipita sp. 399]